MVVSYEIENFLSSWSANNQQPRVDFTILGEPRVQNGWKARWKGLQYPRIYNPKAKDKASLRIVLREALLEVISPPTSLSRYPCGATRPKASTKRTWTI
jgi:hypothetical protein